MRIFLCACRRDVPHFSPAFIQLFVNRKNARVVRCHGVLRGYVEVPALKLKLSFSVRNGTKPACGISSDLEKQNLQNHGGMAQTKSTYLLNSNTGVGKLSVRRATFEKNVAAEGRTLSLQNRKVYSLCKKHIHIKHSFCISHSGTFNAICTVIVRTETYTIFMKFYSSSKTL